METLVDIDAEIRNETEHAYLITDGKINKGGSEVRVWVPKSLTENNGDGTFTMPEWLAIEKELV